MPTPEDTANGDQFDCWTLDETTPVSANFNVGDRASIIFYSKYKVKTNPVNPGGGNGQNGGNQTGQNANSGNGQSQKSASENKVQPPKAVKEKTIKTTAGKAKVSITAKKTGKITGFMIRYKTGSAKWKVIKAKGNKNLKISIKKLKRNKKYKIQVRTYRLVGKKKVYSAWSKVKIIRTK